MIVGLTLLARGELAGCAADVNGLITLDPGHFHAALFQKEMLPGLPERAHVYAPLGPDLFAHLNRIAQFNNRASNPTHWKLEVHAGADFWERFLAERPGNVVVVSGNNRGKIARLEAIVRHGLHVLADKPWIIESADLPALESTLQAAQEQGVVAYDAMTQRFEIAYRLQRELVNDRDVFGTCLAGSAPQPAVYGESVHYLLKDVAGVPSLRPAWFFDVRQQGEGLADVGTHLVDLVQWILFPDQAIDHRQQVQVLAGARWPTVLALAQFQRVTGERDFPEFLRDSVREGRLEYFANNSVAYTLRQIHVKLVIKWDIKAPPGQKDAESLVFCGSRSRIEVRQGKAENWQPEVYVVPNRVGEMDQLLSALRQRLAGLQAAYPGVGLETQRGRFRLEIPAQYRVGHEAHFGLLTRRFLDYVANPRSLPAWEKPNMLAKYYVTTKGIELARRAPPASGRGP